ncbi:MAG: aminopeptidase, partial [Lysobacterales bacterium]
ECDYVVWNVFVAPELSLQAKTWCYPIVGCADYRGYFSENSARAYSDRMAARGFDTYVGGVSAYSTLGWLNDPVLNTFVFREELKLAELIFHELAHQLLYLPGDTMFNESFATTVAREGVRRWVLHQDDAGHYTSYQTRMQQHDDFIRLLGNYRDMLASVYESSSGDDVKRRGKAELINQLRQDYDSLLQEWGGSLPYTEWIAAPINNAKLNSVALYHNLVPGLERLLAEENYQLSNFYVRCRQLRKLTPAERRGRLENNTLVVGESPGIPIP